MKQCIVLKLINIEGLTIIKSQEIAYCYLTSKLY